MWSFGLYLGKVLICMGLFYAYYLVALRNRKIHLYNRFYLLAAFVLPWILPLVTVTISRTEFHQPHVLKLLTLVSSNGSFVEEPGSGAGTTDALCSWGFWLRAMGTVFVFISFLFLAWLIVSTAKLLWLARKSPRDKIHGEAGTIWLVYSESKGAPFSFFNYVFWDSRIDPENTDGQSILAHELAHVHDKHSVDKMILNMGMVFGWSIPFTWLIRRELDMVHEFLADEKTAPADDMAGFASMLLRSAYPGFRPSELVNPFFHTPIKRRFIMLTRSKPGFSMIRRIGSLPLLAIVFSLVAFKIGMPTPAVFDKEYTIIVDAGHGGKDPGATGSNLLEKDVNLSIAKQIKQLNGNPHLHILLTRDDDNFLTPFDRLSFAQAHPADAFISIHTNGPARGGDNASGAVIYLSHNESRYAADSRKLSDDIAGKLQDIFHGDIRLAGHEGTLTVLDRNSSCPGLLIECGFLEDGEKGSVEDGVIRESRRETEIAGQILRGVGTYLSGVK